MLSRANSVGYANDQSPCSHHESPTRNVGSLRRAKSISAVPLVKTALTRSDRLTSDNMHQQAQAAASRAYTNDLRRKESLTGQRPMQRGNSVRFEASPPSDPEYNRYAYFDDYRRTSDGGHFKTSRDDDPFLEDPFYLPSVYSQALNSPSSYRRIRRSRSVFSIQHHRSNIPVPDPYSSAAPERSQSLSGPGLRPHRSMSFLRGGTDFMPRSLHQQKQAVTKRRSFYLPTSSLEIHAPVQIPGIDVPFGSQYLVSQEQPRSFRKKVRKLSESLVQGVRRAFLPASGKTDLPAQHIPSTRSYHETTVRSSMPINDHTYIHNPDIFLSRVSSGIPSLQRAPSSVGYPSQSGSIRIVSPPAPSSTSMSTAGDTWASSVTNSTWTSRNTSNRLSIIPEATPRKGRNRSIGDKENNRQRVYSAYMRISRRAAEGNSDEGQKGNPGHQGSLKRTASIKSRLSSSGTLRKKTNVSNTGGREDYSREEKSTPKSILLPSVGILNDENTRPQKSAEHQSPITRTHITIGPRVTLYPLPVPDTNNLQRPRTSSGPYSPIAGRESEKSQHVVKPVSTKSIRHVQSAATFFPYSPDVALTSLSPYKRATLLSPSVYSRSPSGKTPLPQNHHTSEQSLAHQQSILQNQQESSERKYPELMLREDSGAFNVGDFSPDIISKSSKEASKSSRNDENIPFVSYQGFGYSRVTSNDTQKSAPNENLATGLFNRRNSFRNTSAADTNNSLKPGVEDGESRHRQRVLKSRVPQSFAFTSEGRDKRDIQNALTPTQEHKSSRENGISFERKDRNEVVTQMGKTEQGTTTELGPFPKKVGGIRSEGMQGIKAEEASVESQKSIINTGIIGLAISSECIPKPPNFELARTKQGNAAGFHREEDVLARPRRDVSLESDGAVFL